MEKKEYKKPNNMSIEAYKEQLNTSLKAKLIAERADSEVNGYINTKQDGDETIVEVFLYDKDEPSNYEEGVYNNIPWHKGHKSTFKKIKGKLERKANDII